MIGAAYAGSPVLRTEVAYAGFWRRFAAYWIDIADSALFLSVAFFVSAVTLTQTLWLRVASYVVAAACGLRAIGSPFGMTALDQVAPLLFVAFVLVLSVKLLVGSRPAVAAAPMR